MLVSIICICTFTLFSWDSHFDVLQNASLLYLFKFGIFYGMLIIVGMFGLLFQIIINMCTNINIRRLFLAMIVMLNCIIAIPLYQTEIQFSHNYDEIGSIGKYIQNNINETAVIFWDNSGISDEVVDSVYFALIDYWITNDLRRVNLKNRVSSGDYSKIQDGDYIITNLPTSTEPVYTTSKGLSLYYL
jgi:hypothetical protein